MAWKPEVIADGSGKWCGNRLSFEKQTEAEAYAMDLAYRWTAVRYTRTVEIVGPFSHTWNDQAAVSLT